MRQIRRDESSPRTSHASRRRSSPSRPPAAAISHSASERTQATATTAISRSAGKRKQATATAAKKMPGYRRVTARDRDELRSKSKTDLAPAELSAPDPRQMLRKRLGEEMEALRGILSKAELVVRKNSDKGRAAPRRSKDGRFLAAEARPEAMEADRTPCAKRRKAMPPVEIIEPTPRISKADQIPCAKKRRTTPPVEIIEPRISKEEMFCLGTRLSSLSSNMPARIVEFLSKECTGHTDIKAGEIEIDLGSMKRSAMFQLQKLLDEFAQEEKRRQQKEESMNICRSSPHELEEGKFIEEDCGATATTDTCAVDASPVMALKGLCSPPRVLEDGEMTEEEGVICDAAALVATPETAKSPSNSSSSGSSSSSDGSSGSSSSDSSDSAVLPISKTDASLMLAKGLCTPTRILEDGEMTEEVVDICGDAGPIATEKFVELAESPSNSSSSSSLSGSSSSGSSSFGSSCSDSSDSDSSDSDDEFVTSNRASAVLPKTSAFPMAMPHKVLSPIAEEEFAETRNSRRNNTSLLEDGEIEEEQESRSPMAAKKFSEIVNIAGSSNGQCVRSSPAPAVHPELSKPQPAAQGTVRHFCAKGFDKKRERAANAQGTVRQLYDKAFEKKRELERQRAKEKLEEMERNAKAKPIFDWIHPGQLRQLGITTAVEYAVTSERRFPARRGCPVQSLLGLFLKAE